MKSLRPIRTSKSQGFTLIEMLIVVVIIALLAAFAMTNYQSYVIRSKRVAATGCLTTGAQYMERFYTVNMRYDQSRAGAAPVLPIAECSNDLADAYTISLTSRTATAYTISATPIGNQAAKDTECGTLAMNSLGQKSVTGTSTTAKCF
jgi:type IV pilus assembly protein PilE